MYNLIIRFIGLPTLFIFFFVNRQDIQQNYLPKSTMEDQLLAFFKNHKQSGILDYGYDTITQTCTFYMTSNHYDELRDLLVTTFSDNKITFKFIGVHPAVYIG